MRSYLETVNYSSVNEDSESEIRALRIRSDDRILCITGSGARTLDLLTTGPDRIVSIDMNPCQNYHLELQMAAIRRMEHPEILGFLGITDLKDRVREYRLLRGELSPGARSFWDTHLQDIRDGTFYCGRWERYFGRMASLLEKFRRTSREHLFRCPDIPSQKNVWEREWDSLPWRGFLRMVSTRSCNQYLLMDPGFYRHVDGEFSVYGYYVHRFRIAASNILLRESPFAELLFYGRLSRTLPPYLRPRNFPALRDRLSAVRTVTMSLTDFLLSRRGESFDAFSLSDISSYTDRDSYREIWEGIRRRARKCARICERQFLVKRELPPAIREWFSPDSTLKHELDRLDGSIFYTFNICSVK